MQPQFHVHQGRISCHNMLKEGLSAFTEDRPITHLPIGREYRVTDFFPDVVQVQIIAGRRDLSDIAIVHEIAIGDAPVAVGVGKESG